IFVKVKGITDDKLFVATEGSDSELTCHAIGIFVKVQGITDDKLFVATEGSDSELTCHAIDFNTGQEYVGSKVTYGWDWRQMDGEPADISELVDVLETDDNKIKLSNIKSTSPKKGRCLVTVWPEDGATDQQPKQYASEFFFTNIQPLDATEKLKPEDIIPFDGEWISHGKFHCSKH
ncbi:unnamed protein product, partial [Trichobilharzia regenti]